ncbi:MAG: hypothetical protein CVV31_06400 [Methanomicrobiales archaeon HGW-Methanomicrobiales-2]|nr:MAG: hypothetical protein CVV31_06400 [Methanomicrobiales archaeon HGW-Methanomicrobiales-2]
MVIEAGLSVPDMNLALSGGRQAHRQKIFEVEKEITRLKDGVRTASREREAPAGSNMIPHTGWEE